MTDDIDEPCSAYTDYAAVQTSRHTRTNIHISNSNKHWISTCYWLQKTSTKAVTSRVPSSQQVDEKKVEVHDDDNDDGDDDCQFV